MSKCRVVNPWKNAEEMAKQKIRKKQKEEPEIVETKPEVDTEAVEDILTEVKEIEESVSPKKKKRSKGKVIKVEEIDITGD